MKMLVRTACLVLLSALAYHVALSQAGSSAVPMCAANQLSLATDDENGSFNGMSHGGTLLVLRNLGTGPCRIEAFPEIVFSDAEGPVKITFTTPGGKFMHPGPVMIPAVVASGAEVTASLRWVSSPVFDPGVCFDVKSVAVRIGTDEQQSPLAATMCGPGAGSVSVERTRFALDPTYAPGKPK